MPTTQLNETSEELLDALSSTLALTFGQESIFVDTLHTGGGVMVCAIDLSLDARMMGRQAWLTREEDWVLGFYDFAADPEDEGVCVSLMLNASDSENPLVIASKVAGILSRLGVKKLQGE